jgi:hypothetical protein
MYIHFPYICHSGLGFGAIAAIVLGVLAFPAVVGGGVLHIRKQNFGLVC